MFDLPLLESDARLHHRLHNRYKPCHLFDWRRRDDLLCPLRDLQRSFGFHVANDALQEPRNVCVLRLPKLRLAEPHVLLQ